MGRIRGAGPGPAQYNLPPLTGYKDHDLSKYRNPQYSIGLRLPTLRKDLGPGPKYQIENMTQYGKAQPPAYSVSSRPQTLKTDQRPGPANYDIRAKNLENPAYSMSFRPKDVKTSTTPGPDKYMLPTTIGPKVPDIHTNGAYSMGTKHEYQTKEQSPGPARYDTTDVNFFKNRSPRYTISSKTADIHNKGQSPGPNAYYPELGRKGGYSFGLRTDQDPYITPEDDMPCINK